MPLPGVNKKGWSRPVRKAVLIRNVKIIPGVKRQSRLNHTGVMISNRNGSLFSLSSVLTPRCRSCCLYAMEVDHCAAVDRQETLETGNGICIAFLLVLQIDSFLWVNSVVVTNTAPPPPPPEGTRALGSGTQLRFRVHGYLFHTVSAFAKALMCITSERADSSWLRKNDFLRLTLGHLGQVSFFLRYSLLCYCIPPVSRSWKCFLLETQQPRC